MSAMFQQPTEEGRAEAASNFEAKAAAADVQPSSSTTPMLPSDSNAQFEGMFGEFPPDQDNYIPEHMMSDSSAEDDMTLGPDPDSIDQSLLAAPVTSQSGLPSTSLENFGSQSSQMTGITVSMPDPSSASGMEIDPSSMISNMSVLAMQQMMMQNNGSLSPAGMHSGNTSLPSPQGSIHGMPGHSHYRSNDPYDLPDPSIRIKRSGPDSGRSSEAGMREYDPTGMAGNTKRAKGRSSVSRGSSGSTASSGGLTSTNTNTANNANGESTSTTSRGYYYRNRDKTNYSQAHKGTLPSPPMTPESSKRIRCTWNLDETRLLYELLKDTTIEEFPDAQHIRAFLIKADPSCTKTLDHVRNKKANLIQKAHSKSVSVGDILVSDMHKLELEMIGTSGSSSRASSASYAASHPSSSYASGSAGTGGSGAHSHSSASSSREVSHSGHHYQGALSMHREPLTASGTRSSINGNGQSADQKSAASVPHSERADSPAGGTRSNTSTTSMQSGSTSGNYGYSERNGSGSNFSSLSTDPSLGTSQPQSSPTITLSASVLARNAPNQKTSRPSRRRVSKRGPPTLLSPLNQAATSTAQQLAKVASQTASVSATATTSVTGSMLSSPASASGTGSAPTSSGSSSTGDQTAAMQGFRVAVGGSSGATNMDPTALAPSRYELPSSAFQTALFKPPSPLISEMQRWQGWMLEEVSKLVAGQNEIRTQLRLLPIEMSVPPASIASSQVNKLPAASQWISTWPHGEFDEDTESVSDDHSSSANAFPSASNTSTHSPTQW